MKIQYALMSCNANPHYTAYWPTVAAAWLKLGITPVCLFIPDDPATKLPAAPTGSIVHTIPPLKNMHIIQQACMLRFWASWLYPNATVVTSDMDVVPLSRHFFHTQLAAYPDHTYLHLKPDIGEHVFTNVSNIPESSTQINNMRYLQAWFHVAKGKVMHRVLELLPDWETTCKKIMPYYLQQGASIRISMHPWPHHISDFCYFGEEIYTSIRLHHSSYQPIDYIPYQLSKYAGLIGDNLIFLTKENINVKKSDYVGIHASRLSYKESAKIIEHLLTTGTIPKPQIFLWWSIRFGRWCIILTDIPKAKIRIIGPWLSLVLIILVWCLLHILPLPRPYNKVLLIMLWNKRTTLLGQHPLMMRLFYRLARIKNAFSPK